MLLCITKCAAPSDHTIRYAHCTTRLMRSDILQPLSCAYSSTYEYTCNGFNHTLYLLNKYFEP